MEKFQQLMLELGFTGTTRATPKAAAPLSLSMETPAARVAERAPPAPRAPPERKVDAFSESRFRTTPAQKRLGLGSTATVFHVWYVDDRSTGARVTGYGPTPGERRTDAIRKFRAGGTDKAREYERSMERYGRPPGGGGTFEPWR